MWAEQRGVTYSCSVWDQPAAREIISLEPKWIKVPSARNTDWDLLTLLYGEYTGDIHISLGMITRTELKMLADFVAALDAGDRTVFYACTSGYPVPAEDVCLLELEWLRSKYGGMDASMLKRVKVLEAENARLKKMYADVQLEAHAMKEALVKKW